MHRVASIDKPRRIDQENDSLGFSSLHATVTPEEIIETSEHSDTHEGCSFHPMYLQSDATEYLSPICFEYGMDFDECVLYYACLESQTTGGIVTRVKDNLPTSAALLERTSSNHRPCLRKSKSFGPSIATMRPLRRSSYTATPTLADISSALVRTNSTKELEQSKPRVHFDAYVTVTTIHSFRELPKKVRSRMWMSRREMQRCLDRAIKEEWFLESATRKEGARAANLAFLRARHSKQSDIPTCSPDKAQDTNSCGVSCGIVVGFGDHAVVPTQRFLLA